MHLDSIRPRRRVGAAMVAVTLAVAACSDDDDGDTVPVSAGPPGSAAATAAAGPSVPSVIATTTPVAPSEPVVPTLDDSDELGGSQLYSVDLDTGAASSLGRIGGEEVGVLGLAFVPGASATSVYALTDAPQLVTFDVADPATLTASVPITGVGDGSTLLALDIDPAAGTVLALSDSAVLYAVDPVTGVATAIGDGLGAPIADPGFGFDVDPATGLGRVEVATGEHLLVVPATGAVDADGESVVGQPLAFEPADGNAAITPRVVAVAFTANGELYAVDAATGSLARQDPPDDGILATVGPLGAQITDGASFDISEAGVALLASPG